MGTDCVARHFWEAILIEVLARQSDAILLGQSEDGLDSVFPIGSFASISHV